MPAASDLRLTAEEQAMQEGAAGPAVARAMRMIVQLAHLSGAAELVAIEAAHIDGCLYHGQAGLDFAETLASEGGRVRVPTTLNVSSLDLVHPDRFRGDAETRQQARRLMDAYVAMGAQATWTCAPYQLGGRPAFGSQIAWAESNAIAFANSVLGARTARYGDFIDIAAALTGRVPLAGLHVTANRRALIQFELTGFTAEMLTQELTYALIGAVVGSRAGNEVPVITGAPRLDEDALKALGAAAASTGAVGMFHVVGSTPEAPTLEAATGGHPPRAVLPVTPGDLLAARAELSSADAHELSGVSLGTPHFSLAEFDRLVRALRGRRVHDSIEFTVNTSRAVLADLAAAGITSELEACAVRLVTDTCTYVTPILRQPRGLVLTNSAKWAYYAPGNLGACAILATLEECVESAVAGRPIRDDAFWTALGQPADPGASTPPVSPAAPGPAARSRTLIAGTATGPALLLRQPLSLWGGVDPASGRIIDTHHPQLGRSVSGTVLIMPGGRGSSSSASVLAEMIRSGTAPAAIGMTEPDEILVLGVLAAAEIYGTSIPMAGLDAPAIGAVRDGTMVRVAAGPDAVVIETLP
jgi:predicted aconitase/predicted aconitase with swiveling domain